jgi:hypothetical protein
MSGMLVCDRENIRVPWEVIANRAFDAIRRALTEADDGAAPGPMATLDALMGFEEAIGPSEAMGPSDDEAAIQRMADGEKLRSAVIRELLKVRRMHALASFSILEF